MNSRLIYVMGPSGAGKDSLLQWLQAHLSANVPVRWARRTISRPANAGGEAHEGVTETEFTDLLAANAFALHWQANGLHYGVRHTELGALADGQWVLVNGSRGYLPQALAHYPDMTVLHITASPDILRQRLLQRGRETPEMIEARIRRSAALERPAQARWIEIHNDSTLDAAGAELLRALARLPGWPGGPDIQGPPAA